MPVTSQLGRRHELQHGGPQRITEQVRLWAGPTRSLEQIIRCQRQPVIVQLELVMILMMMPVLLVLCTLDAVKFQTRSDSESLSNSVT
jgi:membrane protein required for beta-lactamase induction